MWSLPARLVLLCVWDSESEDLQAEASSTRHSMRNLISTAGNEELCGLETLIEINAGCWKGRRQFQGWRTRAGHSAIPSSLCLGGRKGLLDFWSMAIWFWLSGYHSLGIWLSSLAIWFSQSAIWFSSLAIWFCSLAIWFSQSGYLVRAQEGPSRWWILLRSFLWVCFRIWSI